MTLSTVAGFERIGEETSRLVHTPLAGGGEPREREGRIADHDEALKAAAEELAADGLGLDSPELAAIGHRVVHGGLRFTEPTVITGLPVTFLVHPAMFRSEPVSANSGSQ